MSHGSIQGWINNYRPSLDDREAPLSTPPNTGNRITLPPIRTIPNRNNADYDLDNANDDNIDLEDSGSSFTSSLTSLDLSEINEDDDNASREGLQETEDTEGAEGRTESAEGRTESAEGRTEDTEDRTESAEAREVEEDTDTDSSEVDIDTTEGEGEVEDELDQELRENRWLLQQYRNNTRRLLKNVDSYKNKGRHYRHQYHTALTQYQRAQRDYNRLRTLFLNFKTESHRTIQQSITIIAEKNAEITRLLEVQNRLNRQASRNNNTGDDGGDAGGDAGGGAGDGAGGGARGEAESDGEAGSGGSGGDRGSGLCKICMTNTRRIVVLPCKHFAMCRECERRNRITHTDTDTGEPMCPICRTPYTDILSIFV